LHHLALIEVRLKSRFAQAARPFFVAPRPRAVLFLLLNNGLLRRMMPISIDNPLFIPLKGEWFDRFESGDKSDEWRRLGARWNFINCRIGRRVVLSRGYSGRRLGASIGAVRLVKAEVGSAAAGLYGVGTNCIVLELHDIGPIRAGSRRPP
jgi:hypothetical protein